jgi:hypothetical protein
MTTLVNLTRADNGSTVEEDLQGACVTVTPEIFSREAGLLYIDLGDNDFWNRPTYVKINGEMAKLTAKWNMDHGGYSGWWHQRDPSQQLEWCWHEDPVTHAMSIFVYWEDMDHLPEVEYARERDAGITVGEGCRDITIRANIDSCGTGIWVYKARDMDFDRVNVTNSGRGIRLAQSCNNKFGIISDYNIGKVGLHFTASSDRNTVDEYIYDTVGVSECTGALYFSGGSTPSCNNTVGKVIGTGQKYGRYWPIDGAGIFFEDYVVGNVIQEAVIANGFTAVQDNSGSPGNRVYNLTAINCVNTFDQSDSSNVGNGQTVGRIIPKVLALASGPFGVRTPHLTGSDVLTVGKHGPYQSRWEYVTFPDIPHEHKFSFRRDGVNVQGPIAENIS